MSLTEPTSSVFLQDVTAEDIPYLKNVEDDPDVGPFIRPWMPEEHEAALAQENIIYFIACDTKSNERVGFVILRRFEAMPETIEFVRLAIEKRGRGFGKTTIEAVLKFAKKDGFKSVWLEVFPNNERAMMVYNKVSFTEISRSKTDRGFGGKPGEVIRMEHTFLDG